MPKHKLWELILLSGKSFPDAIARIMQHSITVGGRRVIAIHLGTNGVCYKTWSRTMAEKDRLSELLAQAKQLYTVIRSFNATAFIIFFSGIAKESGLEEYKIPDCLF